MPGHGAQSLSGAIEEDNLVRIGRVVLLNDDGSIPIKEDCWRDMRIPWTWSWSAAQKKAPPFRMRMMR